MRTVLKKTPPVSPSCPVCQFPTEPNLIPLPGAVYTGKDSSARDKTNRTTVYLFSYFKKLSGFCEQGSRLQNRILGNILVSTTLSLLGFLCSSGLCPALGVSWARDLS